TTQGPKHNKDILVSITIMLPFIAIFWPSRVAENAGSNYRVIGVFTIILFKNNLCLHWHIPFMQKMIYCSISSLFFLQNRAPIRSLIVFCALMGLKHNMLVSLDLQRFDYKIWIIYEKKMHVIEDISTHYLQKISLVIMNLDDI
ncbi:hypothetical protein ACJX0J_035267, partial [Zea mays]